MAHGTPDWQPAIGRSVVPLWSGAAGQVFSCYTFSGTITAGSSGYITLPGTTTGLEMQAQKLVVSNDNSTAVQEVKLVNVNSGYNNFLAYFALNLICDVREVSIGEDNYIRVYMYNNAATDQTFKGSVSYCVRKSEA